ncbi:MULTISPECIES: asparagine synthase-related protein [unclassified Brevundimonas]|uniref:asparagine synthase-related protein n=1 Tax=unclassified Brevundimonas TaxID=2622653 RepID=UPI0025B8A148|nr:MULTISPECIES: asparagine synthase-related protein [unclassified Brevundimonas]
MGDYLLVCALDGEEEARGQASLTRRLARLARAHDMDVTELGPGGWLAAGGPCPARVTTVSNWRLVGDVLNRRAPTLPACAPDDPWAYERKLVARFWGRYIGVQFGPRGRPTALLRDPSGALECVAWKQDGLLLAASAAFPWLLDACRPRWLINRARLDLALRDPLAAGAPLILDGPVALPPGTVQPLPLDASLVEIWTPALPARRSLAPWPGIEEAAARLREAVDEAVTGLAGLSAPLAAEVSGGLDSSIVAAALVKGDRKAVRLWLNAHGDTPESDERLYLARLAARLDIAPASVPHLRAPMTCESLDALSAGFRPGLNALDQAHQTDWAHRIRAVGAEALMTGRGGDAILLQNATADVFVDLWRARGWRSLLDADARELAAANEASLWTFALQARRRAWSAHPRLQRPHALLKPAAGLMEPHPWVRDWDDYGPAKALQIAGLVDSVARHEPSALTPFVDVRNPLCAQPVVEACLSLPAPVLTLGGRDRGLARHAFRDRLPIEIIERRSKGDMTRLYGRLVHDSLDFLRPWLLEGRLAGLGLLDVDAADLALTREALLWRGGYSAVMVLAAFEGWVRHWEARLAAPAAR